MTGSIKKNGMRKFVITIDGPAGSGKSTVSKILAKSLDYIYIDTGAMYRAVAVLARDTGEPNPLDDALLEAICSELDLQFNSENGEVRLLANGRDVTDEIRKPEISFLASAVSAKPAVRERLSKIQRSLGSAGGVVLEGRDMGTVVFPDADIKFFLDANPEIRSKRRFLELEAKGEETTPAEVHKLMLERDHNDRSRQLAPLKPATDAIVVDSSNMQIEEVVQMMLDYISKRKLEN